MINDYSFSEREVIKRFAVQGSDSVLAVGCGDGEKIASVTHQVSRAVGIDPDINTITRAQKRFARKNMHFFPGRAESLSFTDSSFSTVTFTESLHHVPCGQQEAALKEASRVLGPDGKILIIEPVYNKGSYEEIFRVYHDESLTRQSALRAVVSSLKRDFLLVETGEIRIVCACHDIEDLYINGLGISPAGHDPFRQRTLDILKICEKGPDGAFLIDYHGYPIFEGTPQSGVGGGLSYNAQYTSQICQTECEPFGSRNWFPCKDFPFDKADSVDLRVTHPTAMTTSGNGLLQ